MQKIIVVTSDGPSREDGNVFYSRYLLVESLSLNFDEPIFSDIGVKIDGDGADARMDAIPDRLRELGYMVHDIDWKFVTVTENDPVSVHDVIKDFMKRDK